jgi:hypothetical protein
MSNFRYYNKRNENRIITWTVPGSCPDKPRLARRVAIAILRLRANFYFEIRDFDLRKTRAMAGGISRFRFWKNSSMIPGFRTAR